MTIDNMAVANEILRQLGGQRFIAMTGAKDLVGARDMLAFSLRRGVRGGINKVRIFLTPNDEYDMEFWKIRSKGQPLIMAGYRGLHAPQLRECFTRTTGLETSLGTMANPGYDDSINRDVAIKRIRAGLKLRSGHAWSVTGGRGTAWGWIRVTTPPAHDKKHGRSEMSPGEVIALSRLLGYDKANRGTVTRSGWSIPASNEYYRDAIKRAETGTSDENPKPYWD